MQAGQVCVGEATHNSGQSERWQKKKEGHGQPSPIITSLGEIPKKPRILNLNIAVYYEGIFVKVDG